MAKNARQADILTPSAATRASKPLPKSWTQAAGSMKHHKKALQKYVRRVRKEWD